MQAKARFACLLAVLLTFPVSSCFPFVEKNPEFSQRPYAPEYIPGQIIVKLKKDKKIEDIKELNTRYYITSAEKIFSDLVNLENIYDSLSRQKIELGEKVKRLAQQGKTSKEYKDSEKAATELEIRLLSIQKKIDGQNSCLGEFEPRKKRSTAQKPEPDLKNIHLLKTNDKINIPLMARDYAQSPYVEYAEPDYVVRAQFIPDDPYYYSRNSWGQGYDDLRNLKIIQCAPAWGISRGSGAIVALIDSGIDFSHPDILGNEWKNNLELFQDSFADDTKGWDFVGEDLYHPRQDNDPGDDNGHGTHMAGIIAATCKNAKGITGIAPEAKLMPVKGLDARGLGSASIIANCYKYAADHGADIINCSFAGLGRSRIIRDITQYVDFYGCVIVAAAGNNNDNALNYFPANTDSAITVGALTYNNEKAEFSNWGEKIDVVAPGGDDILSLRATNKDFCRNKNNIVGNDYYRARGTSMAAAHVSGALALIISKYPSFDTGQLKQALRMSAEDQNGMHHWDYLAGYGRINVYKALRTEKPCYVKINTASFRDGSAKTVKVNTSAKGEKFSSYILDYTLGNNFNAFTEIINSTRPAENEDISFNLPAGFGKCLIRLRVYDTLNNIFEDRTILDYATVKINSPLSDAVITDKTMIISGSAAGNDFLDYTIECNTLGVITGDRPVPEETENNTLATLDLNRLKENKTYTLTLKARTKNFKAKTVSVNFSVLKNNLANWPLALQPWVTKAPLIADIDNDSSPEIIVTGFTNFNPGDMITIYRVDGTPHPGWPKYVDKIQLDSENVLAGDLNGDKKLEIIAASETSLDGLNKIFVWDGNGETLPRWPVSLSEPVKGITLADLDNNSELEIIATTFESPAANKKGKVKIYVLNKDGKDLTGWPITITLPASFTDFASPAISGNFAGDKTNEVIIPLSSGKPGSGSWLLAFDARGNEILNKALPYVRKLYTPAIGDIDNDKDNEIIIGADADMGEIFVFHGNGEIAKGWPVKSGDAPAIISLADLDRDGYLEIIADTTADWINAKNSTAVFDYTGKVKPGWPIWHEPNISSVQGPVIADINGDGISEIFSTHQYTADGSIEPGILKLNAWDENGSPLEGYPKLLSDYCLINGWGGSAAFSDLNKDGKIDIIAARGDYGYIYAFPSEENGFLTDSYLKLLNTSCFKDGWDNPSILTDLRDGKTKMADSGSSCGYTYIPPIPIDPDEYIPYWPMFKHDLMHTNNYPREDETEKDIKLILYPGWNFISIGLQLKNPAPQALFDGIDLKDKLYKFDNSLQSNSPYNGPIKPQDGYWFKNTDNNIQVLRCYGKAITGDFTVKIPRAGWANFGSPRGIPWNNCIIKYNNASYTIKQAKTSGLINSTIKMFDAYRQEIVNIGLPGELTGNTFLKPNKGYWIRTLVDNIELLIPRKFTKPQ